MSTPEEHLSACLKFQEYYDNTLRKVGMRAPQPTLGTTVNDYRRETLRTIKRTFLPQNHAPTGRGYERVALARVSSAAGRGLLHRPRTVLRTTSYRALKGTEPQMRQKSEGMKPDAVPWPRFVSTLGPAFLYRRQI